MRIPSVPSFGIRFGATAQAPGRLVSHFVQLPRHFGHFLDVQRYFVDLVEQYEHALFVDALFEVVDARDCPFVGRIASDPPDRIGRIEDDPPPSEDFQRLVNRIFSHVLHNLESHKSTLFFVYF